MEQNTPQPLVKTPYKPSAYAMQYLLSAYKTGYYLSDVTRYSQQAKDAFVHLAIAGYIKIIEISPRFSLTYLTQLGVETVKERFVERLTTGFLYHIYSILVRGDKIEVTDDIENRQAYGFFGESISRIIPKGVYNLVRINRYSITVTDESGKAFLIRTFDHRMVLKLKLPENYKIEDEMSKRFGRINVKYTSKQLGAKIPDNLKLMSLMSGLYELPAVQGRIEGTK